MAICKNGFGVQCKHYITAEQTEDEPGCATDGDISKPELDIYCGEIDGDDEKAWELRKANDTS